MQKGIRHQISSKYFNKSASISLIINNNLTSDQSLVTEAFNSYFASVSTTILLEEIGLNREIFLFCGDLFSRICLFSIFHRVSNL